MGGRDGSEEDEDSSEDKKEEGISKTSKVEFVLCFVLFCFVLFCFVLFCFALLCIIKGKRNRNNKKLKFFNQPTSTLLDQFFQIFSLMVI
ncbi:hypothetical protein EYC80_004884 [Monilinia laxa]|uniref:Uncharacterized protein n=1 Tax=Monilinia laxa TaxID=61186 RepID=A0A5N6KI70_MONLA|nr:hypothetical protein EYC80_004884 [Monilinia laxa]